MSEPKDLRWAVFEELKGLSARAGSSEALVEIGRIMAGLVEQPNQGPNVHQHGHGITSMESRDLTRQHTNQCLVCDPEFATDVTVDYSDAEMGQACDSCRDQGWHEFPTEPDNT
jgi:hypothetical protein